MAQNQTKSKWPREVAVQVVWVVVLSAAIVLLIAYCHPSFLSPAEGHAFMAPRVFWN